MWDMMIVDHVSLPLNPSLHPCPATNLVWFFKSCKNSNLGFHFVKHLPETLFSITCLIKHMMVWWYNTLWPQINTIWTNLKVSYTLFTKALVNHSLTKASKNHNSSFKISQNLFKPSLMASLRQVPSVENNKHEETIFLSTNPALSKLSYDVSRWSCMSVNPK